MPDTTYKYLTDSQTSRPTVEHVNWLTRAMYAIQNQVQNLTSSGITKQQADRLYGPAAIRPHLLGGGAHALNIGGMLGQAAEPQLSDVPITVGILSKVPTDLGTQDAGEIFIATDVGHIFEWQGGSWLMLDGAGYGVFANAHPVPNAYWVAVPPSGGTVNVTNPNATGSTSTAFGAYTALTGGATLWVRI